MITRSLGRLAFGAVAALLVSMLAGANVYGDEPAGAATVNVGGEVKSHLRLDLAALSKLPRQQVEASAHDVSGTWEGVLLADILRAAGAAMGDELRGKNLSLYVRVTAADNYHAVFSLAELDPGIGGAKVIVADHRDGKLLDAKEGPLRVIAAGEKRPARWVRQVVSIDVLRAPDK
ncbi:MAG TPA: molybdopterin-dependent oxidoreductase [Rudaea sp.]|nr:molybdopterin-dependent oxidoreductase [Rudaea sp.]HSC09732.1 molybdopterin-dependent oxidoreductase [Rhodanobacteraceae bacterium]